MASIAETKKKGNQGEPDEKQEIYIPPEKRH